MSTGVFAVAFGVVVETSLHSGRESAAETDSGLQSSAARLAETVFGSGVGWYSTLSCASGTPDPTYLDGDAVDRLGLGREACPGARGPAFDLSFEKLENLNNGQLIADADNGYLDYPEAKASLSLGDRDFHIRSWPVMADITTLLESGTRDPNERVAYIGAYDTLAGGVVQNYVVQKACGKTDGLTSVAVWVDVTNNGTLPADFEVTFSVPLSHQTIEIVKHTGALAAGATQRVTATLPKTAGWAWSGLAKVTVDVADTLRGLGSCISDLTGLTMTSVTTNRIVNARAEKLENLLSGGTVTPKVYYEAYDGTGASVSYTDWKLEIQTVLGIVTASDSSLNSRGWESFTLTLPAAYSIVLKTALGVVLSTDTLNILSATTGSFTPVALPSTYSPKSPVVPELAYLSSLVADFVPNVYSATYTTASVPYAAGGDLYPDIKAALNNDLAAALTDSTGAATLSTYNILVVGSEVDHNAMTSAAAKQTIRDWVFAGGFLMVFGSAEQAVQWLQPIFHSAIASASSSLVTPDSTHPLLHTPNELEYATFDDQDRAWEYNSGAGDYFTHVIMSGDDDVLAVSDSGAFGDGRVLLTSYEPYDITGSGATGSCAAATLDEACPALQIIHNFLTYSYRELYIDYGPALPTGRAVGVVERLATVWHPEVDRNVELVVLIYVF